MSWKKKPSLFPYIGLNCKRAIQQLYSITVTSAHKCQRWVLHPQKFGLYSVSPPLAELLAAAAARGFSQPSLCGAF